MIECHKCHPLPYMGGDFAGPMCMRHTMLALRELHKHDDLEARLAELKAEDAARKAIAGKGEK